VKDKVPIASVGVRAAQLNRWAEGMNMSSERHCILTFPRKRHGAGSALAFERRAVPTVALRLRSPSAGVFSAVPFAGFGRAASVRTQLRSSLRRRLRVVSSLSSLRRVAVRSASAGLSPACCFQSGRLPNKSLVPTPVTNAPLLCVGSGAAQLGRWAA
jgi:hypothetical protein